MTNPPDPAYAYGQAVGAIYKAAGDMFASITRGMHDALNPPPLTAEEISVRRYRASIAAERTIGLTFVANEARRVRRELGLEARR